MTHIVKITPPTGQALFLPFGYGLKTHELATKQSDAGQFPCKQSAMANVLGLTNPPHFWESERRGAQLLRDKYKSHKFEVLEV